MTSSSLSCETSPLICISVILISCYLHIKQYIFDNTHIQDYGAIFNLRCEVDWLLLIQSTYPLPFLPWYIRNKYDLTTFLRPCFGLRGCRIFEENKAFNSSTIVKDYDSFLWTVEPAESKSFGYGMSVISKSTCRLIVSSS